MRHTISLFILLIGLFVLSSCADDLFVEPTKGYVQTGTPVDVSLSLTVGDLDIDVATRATADEIEDTEAERRVNDLWVFEYDAKNKNLIDAPQYIEIKSQDELADIPVRLSDNNGDPCIIYVVTNSGSDEWGESTTNFGTLDALKEHTIFNPGPIRVDGLSSGDTGDTGDTEDTMAIPMGGSVGEDGSGITITQNSRIEVPVKRMFAKLYVHVAILKGEEGTEDIAASLTSFYIERIASTSTVETIYNTDGSWYYPEATRFTVSRYFPASSYPGTTDNDGTTTYGPFILYVPENIQGEAIAGSAAPDYALRLTTGINAEMGEGDGVVTLSPSYVACPGSWSATLNNQEYGEDFNINRNTIYDIQINITVREDDLVTPSANCIIAPPGVTTAFFPYVRDEEPSSDMMSESNWGSELEERYTFTTYLDPSDDPSQSGAKVIRGIKIIWQNESCIGDNSKGDLVWMDPVPDASLTGDARTSAERHRKIYVKPTKEGNALIAAYDDEKCEGNILWSWHIWATNLPIENDAIEYYHYDWDSTNGINTSQFVAGPLVMMCNLGALAEKPTTAGVLNTDTYGMLYQWGRKDPFPPIKATNHGTSGQARKGGPLFYNYADGEILYNTTDRQYTVEIGVYDNSNKQIDLTGYGGALGSSSPNGEFYTKAATTVTGGDLGSTDNEVILQSVRHPTMFIAASSYTFTNNNNETGQANHIGSYDNEGDWLPESDDFLWGGGHPGGDKGEFQVYSQTNGTANEYGQTYRIDAYLENDYGPNKQIFDPCPYGWRVSSGEIWLGFTYDGLNWGKSGLDYTAETGIWNKANCADADMGTVNTQCGYTFYMQGWRTGVTSFFPLQAARCPSGQPYLIGGICGNYHNATVDEPFTLNYNSSNNWNGKYIRRVDILHLHAESTTYGLIKPFTNELYYYTKAVAGPLRCVRDSK